MTQWCKSQFKKRTFIEVSVCKSCQEKINKNKIGKRVSANADTHNILIYWSMRKEIMETGRDQNQDGPSGLQTAGPVQGLAPYH